MLYCFCSLHTGWHKKRQPVYGAIKKYRMNIEHVSVRRDFSRSPQKWSVLCRVGSVVPERIWKKIGCAPPLFGSKSTISRFGERFRDGQYSLVSFLFAILLLTVPSPCPAFLKVGARAPRAPWSRRHCSAHFSNKCCSHSSLPCTFFPPPFYICGGQEQRHKLPQLDLRWKLWICCTWNLMQIVASFSLIQWHFILLSVYVCHSVHKVTSHISHFKISSNVLCILLISEKSASIIF